MKEMKENISTFASFSFSCNGVGEGYGSGHSVVLP